LPNSEYIPRSLSRREYASSTPSSAPAEMGFERAVLILSRMVEWLRFSIFFQGGASVIFGNPLKNMNFRLCGTDESGKWHGGDLANRVLPWR